MSQDVAVAPAARAVTWRPVGWHRGLQLALATVWLLDGVLQLQPFMFTRGSSGFSGMLAGTASGNPAPVAHSITWNASLVDHHAVVLDSCFAVVQILIGFGIAWRPTVRLALGASMAWSLGVWWFGEGLGGVLHGAGTPVAGGPGAVLFYALLAVLLWPPRGDDTRLPFAAAGAVGARAARWTWTATWLLLAVLSLLGAGRAPDGIQQAIQTVDNGEPRWLADLDRHAASAVAGHGLVVALVLTLLSVALAVGVHLPVPWVRATVVVAAAIGLLIWILGENFGMILAGGATDPNSGPLLVLLALAYWPCVRRHASSTHDASSAVPQVV